MALQRYRQTTRMLSNDTSTAPIWHKLVRIAVRLVVIAALVFVVTICVDHISAKLALFESDAAARAMTGLLVTVLIGYALLLAIPFVPGVEIGLAVLVIQGMEAAPFVYVATVSGLFLSFCIGQYAPLDSLIRFFAGFSFHRLCHLLERIKTTPRDQRLAAMEHRLPKWAATFLCDYRYVTLGLSLSLPGNIALGGGGGSLLAAVLSRLFQSRVVLLTLVIATAPVPLIVWIWGAAVLT